IQVATEEEAQQVLARLQDGEKFAALARELSIDPQSKDEGGDRGWLAKGAADRALEETLFALEPGVISDPFPDDSGVLVLQVQEKAVRPLNDDQRQQVQGQNFQRWLDEKRQSLKIDNFVSPDSDKLDEERLQWVLDHGRSVITQPVTPTASP
ncbi:MAG: peptidylprolyl isomerase, partial [Dehalococcoidia bacterium]